MRLLFINQYYKPDFAATAQQLSDLCERLAAAGHEVHVLTSSALYDGRGIKLPEFEVIDGVHVHRVALTSNSRARVRHRMIGYLSFYLKAFVKAHMIPRADVVVTLTTPPMISLLGTWLRTFRRSRFVYWVMDIYPDIAVKAGVLWKYGPIQGIWNLLGRSTYLTANKVVVLGEDMKKTMRAKGVAEAKLEVIQSWSCSEQVHPVEHQNNPFRASLPKPDAFNVMYSGNMGMCHTFVAIVDGIRQMRGEEGVQFTFIGSGKKMPALKEQLADLDGLVAFLPYQERGELKNSLSAGDVHLIALDPEYDGLLVPSKVYGILAAGRPVIFVGSKNNEIARIVDAADCGICVDPKDSNGFVEAVRYMKSNPAEAAEMGRRGRRYFCDHFDRGTLCDKFMQLLEDEALRPGVRGTRQLSHEYVAGLAGGPSVVDSSDGRRGRLK